MNTEYFKCANFKYLKNTLYKTITIVFMHALQLYKLSLIV